LAVAETASPGAFFSRRETLPLVVDSEGFTRINRERGKPLTVCLEPKRDEFMNYYLDELTNQRRGPCRNPSMCPRLKFQACWRELWTCSALGLGIGMKECLSEYQWRGGAGTGLWHPIAAKLGIPTVANCLEDDREDTAARHPLAASL
jgi:hypothetical protein